MAEGNSTPEEVLPKPLEVKKPKLEINEYGEIIGGNFAQKKTASDEPWVDPDDLPENQGMTPKENLARMLEKLNNARPADVSPTGQIVEKPVLPATPPKPSK